MPFFIYVCFFIHRASTFVLNVFFYFTKSLGELSSGGSLGSGHAQRLFEHYLLTDHSQKRSSHRQQELNPHHCGEFFERYLLTDHPTKMSSHRQWELNPHPYGEWANFLPTELLFIYFFLRGKKIILLIYLSIFILGSFLSIFILNFSSILFLSLSYI